MSSGHCCPLWTQQRAPPDACLGSSPSPSPWAASFPLQILIYHPAFIKYVFDSWLQGHGRYPSTGILSVIFSLHVCDEVGRTPSPAASCSPGGRESTCGQDLHPHPQAFSGSSGPVSTVGLAVSSVGPSRKEPCSPGMGASLGRARPIR